jgi:hypothetical protein
MGFRQVIGFIEHVELLTTGNYNDFTDLHNVQVTTAHAKSSVFTNRCLVMDLNNSLCFHRCRLATILQLTHSRN